MKRLVIDYDKCRGCNSCAQACSFRKFGEFNINRSNISVAYLHQENIMLPVICQHCEEPECLEACPEEAIYRDKETNAVVIDQSLCTACETCVTACPIGHPRLDIDSNIILKCDLCGGDPECVKYCGYDALKFISVDEATSKHGNEEAAKIAAMLAS